VGDALRVACFGAGWVTTHRHVPSLRDHGGFDVVALVDRNGERARDEAERLGIPRHVQASSVDELAFRDELDAITCGTAPFVHDAVIRSGIESGKHVLSEKPLTMTTAEAEQLGALARERRRVLAVVHNFQFARSVRQLRGWMESGRIGAPRGIWAMQLSNPDRRLPPWVEELPLGLFYDESPHMFYLVRALAGGELEPVSTTVHPSTHGATTPAHIDVQMRAGAMPVTLQMSFEAPVSEWHVTVLGDAGMGTVDLFRDIAVYMPNDGRHRTPEVLRSSAAASWHHWLGYLRSGPRHLRGSLLYGNDEVVRRFHDAVRDGGRPEGIGADDALEVLRMQHWVIESAGA
jgi:scyllo-inositol 2-dehydrogenase (NADP+)